MKKLSKFIACLLILTLIAVFMPQEMYVTLADDIQESKLTETVTVDSAKEADTDENPAINYDSGEDAYIQNRGKIVELKRYNYIIELLLI